MVQSRAEKSTLTVPMAHGNWLFFLFDGLQNLTQHFKLMSVYWYNSFFKSNAIVYNN